MPKLYSNLMVNYAKTMDKLIIIIEVSASFSSFTSFGSLTSFGSFGSFEISGDFVKLVSQFHVHHTTETP